MKDFVFEILLNKIHIYIYVFTYIYILMCIYNDKVIFFLFSGLVEYVNMLAVCSGIFNVEFIWDII